MRGDGFARTYEGLKQPRSQPRSGEDHERFARTYEGLKLRLPLGHDVRGDVVLPVPMRD